MAKVSDIVSLFVFICIWHIISGQTSCSNNPCSCCKNNKCETNNDNHCTDGCIHGFWGSMCYNECPTNCEACTQRSGTCTACVTGKYSGKYHDNRRLTSYDDCRQTCRTRCLSCTSYNNCNECVDGRYGTSCKEYCRSECVSCTDVDNCDECVDCRYGTSCRGYCRRECVSCTDWDNCDECVDGRYGTSCRGYCYNECEDGVCDKEDGKCKCKAGYTSSFCRCASNEFGQYPDCFACPAKCSTCSSNTECSNCIAGWYGSNCMNECSTFCKDSFCSMNGSCIACTDGYYGSGCQSECQEQCKACFSLNKCTTCLSGFFGPLCNGTCPENCMVCTSLTTCQACKPGFKGTHCQDECQNCKTGTKCDKNSGRCDTCIYGKFWDNCENNCDPNCLSCERQVYYKCIECQPGKYGYNSYLLCDKNCPINNCLNNTCDANTGHCNECKDGFSGTYCRCPVKCQTCATNGNCQSCIEGYDNIKNKCECRKDKCSTLGCDQCNDRAWYPDVNSQTCCPCSSNCKGGQCVSDTECASGCKDGYYRKACDILCSDIDNNCLQCTHDDNEYFNNCTKCSLGYYLYLNYCKLCDWNCLNRNCDQRSGKCLDGCENRLWGEKCESYCSENCITCNQDNGDCEVCKSGNYKTDCAVSCSENCSVLIGKKLKCRINDGACLDGCVSTKVYGLQCSEDCSSNCKDGDCEWKTGNCLTCVANKYGPICGDECNNNCVTNSQDSLSTRCYGENGTCTVGCISGFHGYKCEARCSQTCSNITCDRLNGECLHGCLEGYTGGTCTQALVNIEPETKMGSGAAIGGAVGGVVVVALIIIAVVFLVRRRVTSNASTNSKGEIQDKPDGMSGHVHIYDNSKESVNMFATVPDESVNSGIKPVSNMNFNKPPVTCKSKAEAEDFRKSLKPEDLRKSVELDDLRKPTKSMTQNHEIEIEIYNVDNDVGTAIPTKTTTTEGNYGYYNVAGIKRGIPVAKLEEHVAKRDKDDFEQEFKEFKNGLVRPYLESQKPQNRARNRYQHIYPYDEHRVHLQGSSTDYINASHIDGYQHTREYIACLGPTEKATEDFVIVWMMIWEQKVEKIAMVTNLFENGVMKCEQYWPAVTTSLTYGDVTVTCHSEDEYADYTLRSFTVSKGSENRSLHHIHYTAWPDKGVPDNVTSIIEFRQRVNSIQTKLGGPVIVHCSAGVGRTGTYIALDSLTKEGQATQSVDIYGLVQKMREQRVNMVQTAEQYQYLHSAIVHSLTFDCGAVTAEQFKQHFKNMDEKTMAAKFKQLQTTIEKKSEEEVKAIAVNNKHKGLNRPGADIPGDYRRPKLYINKDIESCDYINAVFDNSFKTKNRFIAAMTPLPGTVLDFITLLYQENCSCIVSLESPESLNDKNVGTYYPANNQELKHDVFKVTCTKGVTSDSYVMRKLTITLNKKPEATSKTFNHFQFTKWSRGGHVPSDPASFLQLISDVETKANATADNGPILIHCLNGAARSGLFCAVSILRQKMEIEHEVSVVNTVRYIKSRRPSAIPNKDQYAFCHQAVVVYLDTFDKDIYSNFSLKL